MTLKEKLRNGQPVTGIFIKSASPALVEILGHVGFDYVLLDMEHSPVPIDQLENLIRAAETAGIAPIVRVAEINEPAILHPLDKGARGLLIPMVDTEVSAQKVVQCAKYGPLGTRGMDIYSRAAKFGAIPKAEYFEQANRDTLIAVQIEGQEGLRNLSAIADTEAVDVVYIGPYDLSQSLGIPGQVNDTRVIQCVEGIVREVLAKGKSAGIYVDDVPTAQRYLDIGIQFITLCVDTTIFFRACQAMAAQMGLRGA